MSVAVALLLALQGTGAPGSLTFDVRCAFTAAQLAQSQDASARLAGTMAMNFFFGRLDGRVLDTELEETIWREAQAMPPEQQAQRLRECGAYMEARGRRLQEIGGRISAREQAATQH